MGEEIHCMGECYFIIVFLLKYIFPITFSCLVCDRPLWVAVQGLIRPTPYTYIHTYMSCMYIILTFTMKSVDVQSFY
jgi:hypothetical protein